MITEMKELNTLHTLTFHLIIYPAVHGPFPKLVLPSAGYWTSMAGSPGQLELSFTYDFDHVLIYIMCKCHVSITFYWFGFSPKNQPSRMPSFAQICLWKPPQVVHNVYNQSQVTHLAGHLQVEVF